jgi:3-deoxy-7-phosphoheptulonate synthase/chorismate mutase
MTADTGLRALRDAIDELDEQILSQILKRGQIVQQIMALKGSLGLDAFDPQRETEILGRLTAARTQPFDPGQVKAIFKAIFHASLDLKDRERWQQLQVKRKDLVPKEGILVGGVPVGTGGPVLFVGPCSVETPEQMDAIASFISKLPGKKILRGGAYKPRTSPYAFQGLREKGLQLLRETADRYGLATVTEVLDVSTLDVVAAHSDMLQIGARNMSNTELLKAVGSSGKPVLLKRGFMSTLEELLLAAEYILSSGNSSVVLCERGIRTFEPWTRNTLDIAAVPLLKLETALPVIVDLSHSLGRTDIMTACARAALAAGADGLMIEAHPTPELALSDGFQQLDCEGLRALVEDLGIGAAPAGQSKGERFAAARERLG